MVAAVGLLLAATPGFAHHSFNAQYRQRGHARPEEETCSVYLYAVHRCELLATLAVPGVNRICTRSPNKPIPAKLAPA